MSSPSVQYFTSLKLLFKTTCELPLDTPMLLCRYECKEFGKHFKKTDGQYYPKLQVTCQANKKWDTESIPDECACNIIIPLTEGSESYWYFLCLQGDTASIPRSHHLRTRSTTRPSAFRICQRLVKTCATSAKLEVTTRSKGIGARTISTSSAGTTIPWRSRLNGPFA